MKGEGMGANVREQRGFSLIETMVALGILGMVGMAFMMALGTGSKATGALDQQVQAAALARSQIEEVLNGVYNTNVGCYPSCYSVTVTSPPDYSLSIRTERLDASVNNALQKITVSVSRSGRPVVSLATYRKK